MPYRYSTTPLAFYYVTRRVLLICQDVNIISHQADAPPQGQHPENTITLLRLPSETLAVLWPRTSVPSGQLHARLVESQIHRSGPYTTIRDARGIRRVQCAACVCTIIHRPSTGRIGHYANPTHQRRVVGSLHRLG
ncbi:hypothetical protein LZ31DRAFT_206554 [Colletotrichum somersetense]|nr:hypothetical protein LZ31DRAFT_206554 [Colletotrichum somersetense]